jgi:hypothetical protein
MIAWQVTTRKTATNARERLWPFVTYDQYIPSGPGVKVFSRHGLLEIG